MTERNNKSREEVKKLLQKLKENKFTEHFDICCETIIKKLEKINRKETWPSVETNKKIREEWATKLRELKKSFRSTFEILEKCNIDKNHAESIKKKYKEILYYLREGMKIAMKKESVCRNLTEEEVIGDTPFAEFFDQFGRNVYFTLDELMKKEDEIINYIVNSNLADAEIIALLKYLKEIDWKVRILKKLKHNNH